YSERAYLLGQSFVIHALMHPVPALDDIIASVYLRREVAPRSVGGFHNLLHEIIAKTKEIVQTSEHRADEADVHLTTPSTTSIARATGSGKEVDPGDITRVSGGALLLLRKHLKELLLISAERK
ncbi:MAG: hypothetical protein M1838_001377, partial [Thelocarpon superellum]